MRRFDPFRARSPWLAPAVTALFLLVFAPSAGAQSLLYKLSSGGNATLTGNVGGGVTTQSGSDSVIVTVVNFGDVGPNNRSGYVCLRQPLMLRARWLSNLKVAVTAESFGPGASRIGKQDIGIGFVNLAASGPNADISGTTIVPAFASDPCAAPKSPDGIPTYSATLASVSTSAPGTDAIVSTRIISPRGSFSSSSNAALVDLKLAVAPQAFRAGTFSLTLTITLTGP
jgi:hypothetical protein